MGINKDLGLPFGEGMEKVAIAFDVDGTLIENDDLNPSTFVLLDALIQQPWKNLDVIVWSGGGSDYAYTQVARRLPKKIVDSISFYSKLEYLKVKSKYDKIIAIDDIQDTRLGDVNLIVRNK